ncbi:Predicted O-methyltransferase YrrM [Clostridium acidisoli DSM 12555]|jgi:predicted O-methyltransferase YrrM|uniref:Predicted O-methyltransferase YrrM n=1 Tax=Clostridium acidisoli DSM 12555 TaxID=1121291 RepID=A0A1W1X487_9CLOT|nr:O-methyltransferase [Clostridium acidisoli]SMC18528.1 Predicted O-methyltransferase YrrM [Clostridium acidisoli DSM 12555]
MNKITEYIQSFITIDNKQINEIVKQDEVMNDIQPCVGMEVGKLLGLLIRSNSAKRVLEFGTCLGYSTVWIAQALKETGGRLTSVEYREDLYEITKRNIELAGLSEVVELILGDASEVINTAQGPFDIILQDSDKSLYSPMLEKCISLTRKNGLIIADDVLFKPMGIPEKFSEPVHEYLKKVSSDKRLYNTILPIGDGLAISIKLCD